MSRSNGKRGSAGVSHPQAKGGTGWDVQPPRSDVRHLEVKSEHGESSPESVVVHLTTESPTGGDWTFTRVEFRLPYGICVTALSEHVAVFEVNGDIEHRSMVSSLEFLVDMLRATGHTPARSRV